MHTVFRPLGGADKFQRRVFEWFGASVAAALGFFSATGVEFYSWQLMSRVSGATAWTVILLMIGVVRLGALYINGRWRPTYHIRTFTSVVSAIAWFEMMLAAMGASGGPFRLEGSVVFLAMVIAEAFVASIAAAEARVADEAAKINAGVPAHGEP